MNPHTATKTGKFITIEGIEGVGKSTCLNYLKTLLSDYKIPAIFTREPGGTPIAERIREILLAHHPETMSSDTELLLIFAGRAQHVEQLIKPTLACGKWVISDRFTDASLAYQGGGRGIDVTRIEMLANWVLEGFQPDLTLLLNAPVEVALARAKARSTPDRIEAETTQFFQRVHDAYALLANQDPKRYRIIDANLPLPEVFQCIQNVIDDFIRDQSL